MEETNKIIFLNSVFQVDKQSFCFKTRAQFQLFRIGTSSKVSAVSKVAPRAPLQYEWPGTSPRRRAWQTDWQDCKAQTFNTQRNYLYRPGQSPL